MQEVIDEYSICSPKNLTDFSYVWRINNINIIIKVLNSGMSKKSPEFSADELKLYLQIQPTHHTWPQYLVLLCSECPSGQLINFNLYILDSSGKQIINDKYFYEIDIDPECEPIQLTQFKLSDFYSSTDAIIICKGQYRKFEKSENFKPSECHLGNQLAQKFGNQNFYDITFSLSGKEFRAHKCILAARTLIFKKMFDDGAKEKIVLNDVTPEIFEDILRFIYTGNVPLEKVSFELLDAANNFGLMQLQAICVKQLSSKLTIENVCDLLVIANQHKVLDLKKTCINFIIVYANEVMKTDKWKLIMHTSSDLSTIICQKILLQHEFWKGMHTLVINKLPNFFVESSFAVTSAITTKFNYQWTIKNFSVCTETKNFTSPKFCKELYIRITMNNDVSLNLIVQKNTVITECKFAIINKNHEKDIHNDIVKICRFTGAQGGINDFIRTDYLLDETNGFISNDTLTITCIGSMLFSLDRFSLDQILSTKFKIPDCDLGYNLSLLKNSKFSDVTIDVSGKEFHAHKLILSARSPVFQAMFEHDMEESRLGKVVITDINPEVFEEMLFYIYTGKVSNIEDINTDLICAADKYALEELKMICQQNLSDNLSCDSAFETLIIAETHNLKKLKASAIGFIKKNAQIVMNSNDWDSMAKTHPSLIIEICETAIE